LKTEKIWITTSRVLIWIRPPHIHTFQMPICPMFALLPQLLGFFQTVQSKVPDCNSFFVLTLHPILSFNPSIIRASIKACNNHESTNTPEKLHHFFSYPLSKFLYPLLFMFTCLVCFWRQTLLVKPTPCINFQHHYYHLDVKIKWNIFFTFGANLLQEWTIFILLVLLLLVEIFLLTT